MANHEVSEADMKDAFEQVDTDNDGIIDCDQFIEGMKLLGQELNDNEVAVLVQPYPNRDEFEFQDFVDMAVIKLGENTEETITEAFQSLDRNEEGFITEENFRRIMTTMGEPMSNEEFKQMMSFVKLDREGNFQYEELLANLAEKSPGFAFQKLT